MFEPEIGRIVLREANAADSRRLWKWRNEESAREASFNNRVIPYEEHERWFQSRLGDGRTRILIAMDAHGWEVGYIRFDLSNESAEISICVDVNHRSRGYGTVIIRNGSEWILSARLARRILARVKVLNRASLAAFERAGYSRIRRTFVGDAETWELQYPTMGAAGATNGRRCSKTAQVSRVRNDMRD
jgi:RimJ/RimL family protein N-acetyltransferase